MEKLIERFIRYAQVNTQSDERADRCPSTPGQRVLALMLAEEMKEIGLQDVSLDENGYLMATLPSNLPGAIPALGFLAHLDTSPDFTAADVKPQLVEYHGGDIVLHAGENIVLSASEFPALNNYAGQTLITTDGTTLLGADDKAGIAEIMTAMDYLKRHPEIKHGPVRIAFTPDEEIGRGADLFDVARFGARFAFTMDGGELGELQYENFNAAKAIVTVHGRNVHPGTAKNQMKNSLLIAMELNQMLPAVEVPAHTDGYEGFFHLNHMEGTVEQTTMLYIVRDHDMQRFIDKKMLLTEVTAFLNRKYGPETVVLTLTDQYYNMRDKIAPMFHIIDLAQNAMTACGVEPHIIPVRGGTDGSRLSFMGLPCPNIFAGGHNFHSRFEFVPVKSMEKAVRIIVKIIELHAREHS